MNSIVGDKFYWQYIYLNQWRSQNAEKVTHIKGRLLEQAVIFLIAPLFINGTSLKGKNLLPQIEQFFPLRTVPFGMENHFYHINCV